MSDLEEVTLVQRTRLQGDDAVPFWERLDPLQEIEWREAFANGWSRISNSRSSLQIDSSGTLRTYWERDFAPIFVSGVELHNHKALSAVALLNQWDQLTTYQLAALMGETPKTIMKVIEPLYANGIVQQLVPGWCGRSGKDDSGSGSLWRLDRKCWTTEIWFRALSDLTWALITNGADPYKSSVGASTRTAYRHNMIAVETVIKAMECIPSVVGGWGERHAKWSDFVDRNKIGVDLNAVGDCIIVNNDGRIILFEVTGAQDVWHLQAKLVDKAVKWATVAAYSPLDLHVVFLDASNTGQYPRICKMVGVGLRDRLHERIPNATDRDRGASRIHVADGASWFPLPRAVSQQFVDLHCYTPWSDLALDLIDGSAPQLLDHVVNTVYALHTPQWISHPVCEHPAVFEMSG